MIRIVLALFLLGSSSLAQTLAPGGPGKDAQWATAAKQAIGTSATSTSKVWFTLANGVMTEVYYPDVTTANVHLLQFVVLNPANGKVETELDDAIHEIRQTRNDSLSFRQINTAKNGSWRTVKQYVVDPDNNTVLIYLYALSRKDRKFFIYFDPSIGNSGMGDTAWTKPSIAPKNREGALLSSDGNIAVALMAGVDFHPKVSGGWPFRADNSFLGPDDGLNRLRARKPLEYFQRAENGNVVQIAQVGYVSFVDKADIGQDMSGFANLEIAFGAVFALGFGRNSEEALAAGRASLDKDFSRQRSAYEQGWADYVKTLPQVDKEYQTQFNTAAMVLKAHEDKTHPGANIASLSIPWGGGVNANLPDVGGYHLVWSRDLYQVATAFMALGDKAAAIRALDFLFKVQQRKDGSFPQNSWLDGKPYWTSLQMDEVAYPLILSYQLERFDPATYDHVKRAADFIVANGPATPQERWEEESGYSPSTIAAEIAGLVCAAEIAKRNGDEKSSERWLKVADEWEANVEKWTATTTGKYGDRNYYLRITAKGRPDSGEKIELNNGGGTFDERDIVDAGFLELVRLGIRSPDDPLIVKSLKVIDSLIKVDTRNGEGFYRYNHDGYGEMDDGRRWNWDGKYAGKGRLWALLSGERGQYEIADCGSRNADLSSRDSCLARARRRLDAMLGFANEGLMIPEQVWDKKDVPRVDRQFVPELKFGEGTGSATPLAWSMAQFIRLTVNLKAGRNLDTPDVVYRRYVSKR